jgi:hypothetical protein
MAVAVVGSAPGVAVMSSSRGGIGLEQEEEEEEEGGRRHSWRAREAK